MKKLLNKFRKKGQASSLRITNETVSEYREQVISRGRRFKYPSLYSKQKLIVNTVIISLFAAISAVLFGWWQLYIKQNTSNFAYQVVRVFPVPVANVNGERVSYSSYLLKLQSSKHYLEKKEHILLDSPDNASRLVFFKEKALADAIVDAYAQQLARQEGISISEQELTDFIDAQRLIDGQEISVRARDAINQDFYGWTPDEYRTIMRAKLLSREVAYYVDGGAKQKADKLDEVIRKTSKDTSWQDVLKKDPELFSDVVYGVSGLVSKNNQDGGLASQASKMKPGEVSDLFKSTSEGKFYYALVRTISVNKSQVNYEFLLVPVTKFDKMLQELYKENKVKTYIDVPIDDTKVEVGQAK